MLVYVALGRSCVAARPPSGSRPAEGLNRSNQPSDRFIGDRRRFRNTIYRTNPLQSVQSATLRSFRTQRWLLDELRQRERPVGPIEIVSWYQRAKHAG